MRVFVHCALLSLNYDFLCRCGRFLMVVHQGVSEPQPPEEAKKRETQSVVFVRASSRHALIVTPDIVTHGAMW